MFKLWVKLFNETRLIKDTVIEDDSTETRTHKILNALDKACVEFDLSRPVWLDSNISEFKRISKVRFTKDNFVDNFEYDYLEIQILEEDY